MPRSHAAILPALALTTTSHPMTAKRAAPSFVGRGFNRDKTPHYKTKGLQPLKHAPNSPLTHFSPVNFYCGHYGSSPRKTKGTSQTESSQKKGVVPPERRLQVFRF